MADDSYQKIYDNKHDVVNEFIQKKQSTDSSHRTLNSYSRTLQKFFHEQFPALTPSEVAVRHVEDYVVSLDQRGPSQNTKRRYLESLSAFYDWTMRRPRFEEITISGYSSSTVSSHLSTRREMLGRTTISTIEGT